MKLVMMKVNDDEGCDKLLQIKVVSKNHEDGCVKE